MTWLRRASRPSWRFVLFLVAIGIAGMHTTGHLGGEHAGLPATHAPAVDAPDETAGHGGVETVAVVRFAAIEGTALDAADPAMGPMQMCLAIVSLTGLMLLVRLLCRHVASLVRAVLRRSDSIPRSPRAPPMSGGLRIVEVSVLRI